MLSEQLILLINAFFPDAQRGMLRQKRDLASYADFEYQRAPSNLTMFEPQPDLRGKDVLEIGCGMGGGTRYYSELGARSVTTLDIDVPRTTWAARILRAATRNFPPAEFVIGDARQMAFPDASFDLIVSTNTFEHIQDPLPALRELARVLRPGGLAFIAFPPYHTPWGAHLVNWIRFPWCHVLFSERDLMAAARRIEARRRLYGWMPPEIQLDLNHDEIPHLNRLGSIEYDQMLEQTPVLRVVTRRNLPIGWRRYRRLTRLLEPVLAVPRLRDYFTTQAISVLQRAPV